MEIDWLRRNRLMRLHFTCELVLILMNRLFNGTQKALLVHAFRHQLQGDPGAVRINLMNIKDPPG